MRTGTGQPAALTCDEAEEQLGEAISLYLDGGPVTGGVASSIVDATGAWPRLLRVGAISLDRLREVAADLDPLEDPIEAAPEGPAEDAPEDAPEDPAEAGG